ncbi:hormogonium polysaccharide biosynthesis glycosyltransferase HpsE [Calothrix sp. 336/3]|uniref:hormogonium polysaccharide biosynthesis glycosyltransferase HpsE n=1 Tax=Calothrix sp. 336/3 TaxID=1337936 RepID=UPI0004E38A47|nr:hormogonium polysaccharide biosynthesis glycosyltransferase HpsE [Calothrix sp. 336/3]AKG23337.1 glycosyl transferase [Calothrix sp. 336/3]
MSDNNQVTLNFSLAIPTYNGESRLPKILVKLSEQIRTEEFTWEIIIIDNNSYDNTAKVIFDYQERLQDKCIIRYVRETRQGLGYARERAILEAKGELIGFLDDDIIPAQDWIYQAIKFAKDKPDLGAFGGQIHGDFEIKPPENFHRIASFLAIRERGENANLYDPINLSLPPGAALVVRKDVWNKSVPNKLFFRGRLGKSMIGGEDFEILLYIHKAGWKIWYNPEMHAYHQIPAWRLEKNYLISLARGCGLSIYQLRLINATKSQSILFLFKVILGNLKKIIFHVLKYNHIVYTDEVFRAEMEFYFSSMISPLYFLKAYINN